MSEGYGNLGWQIFVYTSYAIVGGTLFLYVWLSIFSRKKSLKNMQDEGFFQEDYSDNPSIGENKG